MQFKLQCNKKALLHIESAGGKELLVAAKTNDILQNIHWVPRLGPAGKLTSSWAVRKFHVSWQQLATCRRSQHSGFKFTVLVQPKFALCSNIKTSLAEVPKLRGTLSWGRSGWTKQMQAACYDIYKRQVPKNLKTMQHRAGHDSSYRHRPNLHVTTVSYERWVGSVKCHEA